MWLCLVPTLVGLFLWNASGYAAEAPLPPPRPPGIAQEQRSAAPTADPSAAASQLPSAPLPPPRPPGIEHGTPSPEPVAEPPPATAELPPEEMQACLARLAQSGARAEPAPPIANGACGAKTPLKILTLPSGIEVSPPAIVTCDVAEALAKWAADSVKPEAERHLSDAPTKILIGTSYECRGRNRQAGAKLSEHAFANAVDLMGFEFRKRRPIPIASRPDESPEAMFLGAVRAQACEHFTTVLGPGSDAAHADHLHLDMRERKRGAKLCQ
jgi:hypothetical protein